MNNEQGSERQDKHVELANSVRRIDSILDHLNLLSERIIGQIPKGEDKEGDNCIKESKPTLSDVLSSTPDLIHSKIEEAHKKIDQIQKYLF